MIPNANPLLSDAATPEPEAPPTPVTFAEADKFLKKLLTYNATVVDNRTVNRKLRSLDPALLDLPVNVTGDDAGKLTGSDVQITVHQIHKLLSRKFPALYQFLTKPDRVAVFTPLVDGAAELTQVQALEQWITRLYRYSGWKTPLNLWIDGSLLHGYTGLEQVYSPDTPGNFKFEYAAYGDIIFPEGTIDIEAAEYVMVRKYLTHREIDELKEMPGANVPELEKLYKTSVDRTKIEEVYRVYTKQKDPITNTTLVYAFWYGKQCTTFLVDPQPLYCGEVELRQGEPMPAIDPMTGMPQRDMMGNIMMTQPEPSKELVIETEYPVILFYPFATEEARIDSSRGQAFWTRSNQKAMCAMASGTVTKAIQAAGVYAAVDAQNIPPGTKPEAISPVVRNTIYTVPVKFTSPDGPDASAIPIMQYFDSQVSDENGQTAYTVANRKDSRKTKEELSQAEEQQDLNTSSLIDNLAEALLKTITRVYRIARSRAKAGVEGYPIDPALLPLLDVEWQIMPAGYTDLIERQQLISNLNLYYPVAMQAGIGLQYSARLMQLVFPKEPFAQQIIAQQQQNGVMQAAYEFIKSTTTPEELNSLSPQQQQQYVQLLSSMEQAIAGGQNGMGAQPGQSGPAEGTQSTPGQPSQPSGNPGM